MLQVINGSLEGLSEEVAQIIFQFWRGLTQTQYKSSFTKLKQFCGLRKLDPMRRDITYSTDFLAELHKEGLSHSAINYVCSALSAFVKLLDGDSIGKHHLVCKFMKGLFNIKPTQP